MTVEFIDDLEKIRAMKPSQILGYVRDGLLDRSDNVRKLEEATIRLGHRTAWHSDAKLDHDASAAAALALQKIIDVGKDQATRGVKLSPLVEDVVKVVRSCLIHEITLRQSGAPAAAEKSAEPVEEAAA